MFNQRKLKIKEKVSQFLSPRDYFKGPPHLQLLHSNVLSVNKVFQKRLICYLILAKNMKYVQTANKELLEAGKNTYSLTVVKPCLHVMYATLNQSGKISMNILKYALIVNASNAIKQFTLKRINITSKHVKETHQNHWLPLAELFQGKSALIQSLQFLVPLSTITDFSPFIFYLLSFIFIILNKHISYNRLLMYKVTQINGVKIYNMSAGKTYSQFQEQAKKNSKSLRYDEEYRRRIELIQDFQFQISTTQVEVSRDERYIVAAGIYAPQIKIFDTAELSLKCLRGIDSEVVKFKILSDDYSKIVMAHTDRSIDFHAQYGAHYKTRIPHYPRDLQYNPFNANLCISASANEVYRLSLEQGKFLTPFHTDSFINSLHHNEKLNVLICGGDQLEVWDFRERKRVCKLQTAHPVSYVSSDPSGLILGVGQGSTLNLYDVRFDRKLLSIRSSYNEPINTIKFMDNAAKNILFSNKKQIKITDGEGKIFTSIEPDHSVNMFTTVNTSGLILAALDEPKVGCYFVPQLGPGPKWVPYVDNITEELEEQHSKVVYDQYKFVSRQQIDQLACQNLINTKMLKQYMHGYLMHLKLYNKLKDKLQQANILQRKQKHVDDLLAKELPNKIQIKQKAEVDSRFRVIEDNPDFEVNRFSEDYMLRHPHLKRQLLKEKDEHQRQLQKQLRIKKKKRIVKK